MDDSKSYIELLKGQLKSIEDRMIHILDSGSLEMHSKSPNPLLAFSDKGLPPPKISYRWAQLIPELEREKNRLQREFQEWAKSFDSLFRDATEAERTEIQAAHLNMYTWLKLRTGSDQFSSVRQAVAQFKEDAQSYYKWLDRIELATSNQTVLVVDSNALIDCPNLDDYINLVDSDSCRVIVTSTVLAELDHLKTIRSNKQLVQRVRTVIRKLKAWSQQGDSSSGFEITDQVSLQMIAAEPQFDSAPDWLDPSNNDDRFLAKVLEIQQENPGSRVIIVTNDLNMQNKASLANISTIEVEECWEDSA